MPAQRQLSGRWLRGHVIAHLGKDLDMPVPGSTGVQLSPPGAATFTVASISDPNGNPTEVLDVDLGFVITGTVTLPNFLQGTATVCIYADELGGPFDARIAPCAQLNIKPGPIPDPSGSTTYD